MRNLHDERILSSRLLGPLPSKAPLGFPTNNNLLSGLVCFEKKKDFYGVLREKSSFYSRPDNDCELCSKRQNSEIKMNNECLAWTPRSKSPVDPK